MATILKGKQFKVKVLSFDEGKSISYQRHHNRSELWLFLTGKGKMRIGKNTYYQRIAGESHLIQRGEWHQFIAEKKTMVLEIQFGGACIERDIERQ